jgi:hypothetical protein
MSITANYKPFVVDNNGVLEYYCLADKMNIADGKLIRKFNTTTKLWATEKIETGYREYATDLNGSSYDNLYAILYSATPKAVLEKYNGTAWSHTHFETTCSAAFAPYSLAVTDSGYIHFAGATISGASFAEPGQYWIYNGTTYSNHTSDLPVPSGLSDVPSLFGIRALSDEFIIMVGFDTSTYKRFIYTLHDGIWSVVEMEYDASTGFSDDIDAGCGSNIFIGEL